jgi:phosphate transport system substrate-binding protein
MHAQPTLHPQGGTMKRTLLQGISILGLIGAITAPEIATAQLKPSVDPHIQSYVRATGISGSLTVAGSETMKGLSLRWESKLKELYPSLVIHVQGIGSETGPPALLEGKAQIAAMSRRMTREEVDAFTKRHGYEPTEVPVAADALAVFVHRDNPISSVTLQDLDAMFCKERPRGKVESITSWTQLGLNGEWSQAPIVLLGRNPASGTATFFREHVCQNGEFKQTMKTEPGSASVVVGVMKDRYAVGFSGIGYRTSTVKPIPLSAGKGSPAIEPTFESTIDGSYPLRRPLYLYINKPPKSPVSPAVTEFVKFAVSQEGQQVVVKEGFFPLPTEELNRQLAAWTQPVQAATVEHRIPARD